MSKKYSYIIVSDTDTWKWCSNLGHELFNTRKILLLLLFNNLIDNNSVIVTAYPDRCFLYTKYFINVVTYNEYVEIKSNNNLLDLRPYLLSLFAGTPEFMRDVGAANGNTIAGLKLLGLNKSYLTENAIFQNTNTSEFNNFICNLDFLNDFENFNGIIKETFFVIHIRPTATAKNLDYLLEFINYCKSTSNINCIIFTQKPEINYDYQTNNLRMYASLLKHNNCLGLIGEWSGGSQIAQFCSKKIIYYYETYPAYYKTEEISSYEAKNNSDFFSYWDNYNPIQCKKMFIRDEELYDKSILLNFLLN